MVGGLLGVGVASESKGGGFQVDFERFVGDIGGRNGKEDVIAFRV